MISEDKKEGDPAGRFSAYFFCQGAGGLPRRKIIRSPPLIELALRSPREKGAEKSKKSAKNQDDRFKRNERRLD